MVGDRNDLCRHVVPTSGVGASSPVAQPCFYELDGPSSFWRSSWLIAPARSVRVSISIESTDIRRSGVGRGCVGRRRSHDLPGIAGWSSGRRARRPHSFFAFELCQLTAFRGQDRDRFASLISPSCTPWTAAPAVDRAPGARSSESLSDHSLTPAARFIQSNNQSAIPVSVAE